VNINNILELIIVKERAGSVKGVQCLRRDVRAVKMKGSHKITKEIIWSYSTH